LQTVALAMDHQGPHFLFLPREIRDLIYCDYLRMGTEDGYTYDFEAGKLRTADKQPIDLSLMYTCRLVANEMRGLPLRFHRITFTTLYSDELRLRAGRWAYLMHLAEDTMYKTLEGVASRMSPEMAREVAQRFGDTFFYRIFQHMRDGNHWRYMHSGPHWGQVPSSHREVVCQVLRLAAREPSLWAYMSEERWAGEDLEGNPIPILQPFDITVELSMVENPWRIPTEAEMDAMVEGLPHWPHPSYTDRKLSCEYWKTDQGKYRFSAAAAAIHFLESVPSAVRRQIRTIHLLEDRVSVALPACHAKGLIPFCLENPELRIERRVSLWRNLFLGSRWAAYLSHDLAAWLQPDNDFRDNELWEDYATMPVAEWMVEASLPMVPNAISLVLDGDPTPEQTAEVFQNTVQRDAAWQRALDKAFVPGRNVDEDVYARRCSKPWHFERFPELLEAMCNNAPSSHVRCNFDPGSPWDEAQIDEIVAENQDREEVTDWHYEWERSTRYPPQPPLPSWQDLLKENVLPEE
jgi:hypothetical protein